jgi:hypothetical protein
LNPVLHAAPDNRAAAQGATPPTARRNSSGSIGYPWVGANAVLNVRFATTSITAGAAEILAYGTAVVLE